MPAIEIRPDIYWIGVNDRTTDLFEGLWPISKEGVSYNAYLINDAKTAIIDLAKAFKTDEFFNQIHSITDISNLDYVVVNHLEPDHSGVLCMLRKLAPKTTILCSEKAVEMLKNFYGIQENVRIVRDGESVSLGRHELQFFMTPFVHWPETMMTYEKKDGILFSCDGFGGYGAFVGNIFDDTCKNPDFYERESLRYYVNIVSKFSGPVLKAIDKLTGLPIQVIAPSHGLIWRKDPGHIIRLYQTWAGYAGGDCKPGVTLVYGSMYGNTEKMMNAVAQGISKTGLDVEIFDAARTHVSYILPSLWLRNSVMIGAPTYEGNLFPPVANVLEKALIKRIPSKKTAYFGSYGWNGGAFRNLKQYIESLKWEMTDQLTFCGDPDDPTLKQGELFGTRFANLTLEKV
ncbi:FprA family A-type flavoprotein [bacterium]|nr:FprA family A-type flavoprotein [bacterium]